MNPLFLLLGCSTELILDVPSGPVAGEVSLTAEGDVEQLVIDVDGVVVGGGEGPALTVDWDSAAVPDGIHIVRAVGYNGDELIAQAEAELETLQEVSTTGPSVNFITPQDGDTGLDGDRVDIVFNVTAAAPLTAVSVFADSKILAHLPVDGPFELGWENVLDGEHCVEARVTDQTNASAQAQACFTVGQGDTGGDTGGNDFICRLTSPADGATVSGTVTTTAAISAEGGISEVRFLANDVLIENQTTSPWTVDWDSSPYAGQNVELRIQAIAAQDGRLCTDSIDVLVEDEQKTQPFAVQITQPTDGGFVSADSTAVPIKAGVGGGAGAVSATLYVDGVARDTLTSSPWQWTWNASIHPNTSAVLEVVGTEAKTGARASDSISVTIGSTVQ